MLPPCTIPASATLEPESGQAFLNRWLSSKTTGIVLFELPQDATPLAKVCRHLVPHHYQPREKGFSKSLFNRCC